MRCPENHCQSEDITHKPVSRTPGFFPDYECNRCGFRWIERGEAVINGRARPRLYELHDAMKEYRARSGTTGEHHRSELTVAGRRGGSS
jgi:hypothetical protein